MLLEQELAAYENEPAVQSLRDLAAQWPAARLALPRMRLLIFRYS